MARRNLAEVLTGAVVLIVAAGFLGYAVAHSGRTTSSGYKLTARFDNIAGLGPGADVRIGGVKVGSVTDERLDPENFQAVVGLSVQNGVKLPKDTAAVITSESLLGGKYLALQPGGEQAVLQPGQSITITQSAVNIEELLGKFIFSAANLTSSQQQGQGSGQQPK